MSQLAPGQGDHWQWRSRAIAGSCNSGRTPAAAIQDVTGSADPGQYRWFFYYRFEGVDVVCR
jgi:hypothetical protein